MSTALRPRVMLRSLSGIVFAVVGFCAVAATASRAQTLTTLASFFGPNGQYPSGSVIQGVDGNFYGTTGAGGANGAGTVFKMAPNGGITSLYSFCTLPLCMDGGQPYAGLVQGSDGNFYGTTYFGGGILSEGVVFRITPGGSMTTLHMFNTEVGEGGGPYDALVQGSDGNLYGTTFYGGTNGAGTVFRITPDGAFSTIYSFCSQPHCTDGALPTTALLLAGDGNFYGTTSGGGAFHNSICDSNGCGTVFRITPDGMLKTLYSFCSKPNCADGATPFLGGLVQASDGNF